MQTITLSGQPYEVGPARARPGLEAIGLLTQHLNVLDPVLTLLLETAQRPREEVQWWQVGQTLLETLEPLFSTEVGDVFHWLSLMTGIEPAILEEAALTELPGVLAAIARENDLAGLLSAARGASQG